jgi:hypothetical protein
LEETIDIAVAMRNSPVNGFAKLAPRFQTQP